MLDFSSAKKTSKCYLVEFIPACSSPYNPITRIFFDTESDVSNFIEKNHTDMCYISVYKMYLLEEW